VVCGYLPTILFLMFSGFLKSSIGIPNYTTRLLSSTKEKKCRVFISLSFLPANPLIRYSSDLINSPVNLLSLIITSASIANIPTFSLPILFASLFLRQRQV